MNSYESILATISALKPSGADGERDLSWIHGQNAVAVARTAGGAIEIFLSGDKLTASTVSVRKKLKHEQWHRKNGAPLLASQLVLPQEGHFDQVAAFICTELLRNGAENDMQGAFARTEAVIALAIESLLEDDTWLRGLLGELTLLEALARNAADDQVATVLNGWKGHDRSLRDFSYGSAGIEVKTTTRNASTHQVEGVHQVEIQLSGDSGGAPDEDSLTLASIGISWDVAKGGDAATLTLPNLVDAIIRRCHGALGDEDGSMQASTLLARVSAYGASARAYDHTTMSNDPFYAKPFAIRFVRGYNMLDPGIQVLTSDDVANRPNTAEGSVKFSINLPEKVDGDINPIDGLNTLAKRIVQNLA